MAAPEPAPAPTPDQIRRWRRYLANERAEAAVYRDRITALERRIIEEGL